MITNPFTSRKLMSELSTLQKEVEMLRDLNAMQSGKLAQYSEQFGSQSAELIAQQQKIEQLTEENRSLAEDLLRKEDIIKRLLNSSFGRRTESLKYNSDLSDCPLFTYFDIKHTFDDSPTEDSKPSDDNSENETITGDVSGPAKKTKKKPGSKKPRRDKIPPHLPVVIKYLNDDCICECCQNPAEHTVRWEVNQEIAYSGVPFYILETHRPVRSCTHCESIARMQELDKPFERSIFHESLVAHIVTEKIAWGLPLYRQIERLAFQNVELSESMMHWAYMGGFELIEPVVKALKNSVFSDVTILDLTHILGRVRTDESINGKYKRASLFGSIGTRREVYLSYGESMTNEDYFEHYNAVTNPFCSDAAAGFGALAKNQGVEQAKCGNHARRKVWEARFSYREQVKEALKLYRKLFRIERRIAGLPPPEKKRIRQKRSAPLCMRLYEWCQEALIRVSPKTSLGIAAKYIIRNWEGLTYFLKDGRMPFHTNDLENIFRIIARGRKAFLQVSSKQGGIALAGYYSLVISCLNIGIDPWLYLTDIFRRVGEHTNANDLIPRRWKVLFMEDAIQRYCKTTHLYLKTPLDNPKEGYSAKKHPGIQNVIDVQAVPVH